MQLKRYKDIIAFRLGDKMSLTENTSGSIIAFHAGNLEVAEVSSELFELMSTIDVCTSEIPEALSSVTNEASTELEDWNGEINPDVKSGKIGFGIRSIAINVNQICNLKCSYCAAGGDGTYGEPTTQISVEKTLPQLKFFLSQLANGSKFSISFIGGEPLLHPVAIKAVYDYVQMVATEKNIRAQFSIVTNGTLIKGDTLKILRQMKVNLTISLDGVPEINDVARPTKNGESSTAMTLAGLRELSHDRGQISSVGIAAVCTPENNDLVTNYHFFKSLNPDWLEFNFAYSEKSTELQAQFITQMAQIAELAWQSGGEVELRKIKTFDHYFKMLDSQQRVESHCGAGKSYLSIDAKNKLYPCHWLAGKDSESIGKHDFIDSTKTAKYSESLIKLNNCESCWAKYLCGGGCMYIHSEHTGNKHIKNNLFCERTRSLILTTLLYYKRSRSAN